jgi:hypothetical protein
MASPAEIQDPELRAALLEADRLLDAGDYTRAAKSCAESYVRFLGRRPDMMPLIVASGGLPGGPDGGGSLPGPGGGGSEGAMARRPLWPRTGGILLVMGADQRPQLKYEKERFSFSEASTYFEYVLAEFARADKQPA